MVLYSIFLQTGNLLFPFLEYHVTQLAIFHTSCAIGMVKMMKLIPNVTSTGNCPKLHYPISVKQQLKILIENNHKIQY